MIEQGLFKKYFVGRDGFYWWIGQIAPAKSWRDNKNGIPGANNKNTPGFGERYKVRIMGHHTASPSDLSDDELPWATVMYPVTAGGGTGGSSQSCNLKQGMFVFGFFMDGEDGQQPVIMGVVGTNSYTAIMKDVPDAKFIPFTGLDIENGEVAATYSRKAKPGGDIVAPESDEVQGEEKENDSVINSVEGAASEVEDAASDVAAEEKDEDIAIPKPSHCDPVPLTGLQLNMANTIKEIEKLRNTLTDARLAATKGVLDVEVEIQKKRNLIRSQVMNAMKWLFDEMIKNGERLANEINKITQGALTGAQNYLNSVTFNTIVDNVVCVLKQIFTALFEYLEDLVGDIIDKVINVTTCFIQNFVSSVLAQIDNLVTQIINTLMDTVLGAINTAFGIADSGLSLATSIVSFVQDILGILSCEAEDGCEEYRDSQWNILTGGRSERSSLDDIINGVKDFSSQFNQVFDFTNGITDVLENQFEFDLDSIFNIDGCDVGPILCGAPSLTIFSGTGAGFSANPVISSSGAIIGVDIVSLGSGYNDDGSYAKIIDDCGNGNGGVIIPFGGSSISDWDDFLNGNSNSIPSPNSGLLANGLRGVTDPAWSSISGSVTSPVFASGPVFTGLIGPDRLSVDDPLNVSVSPQPTDQGSPTTGSILPIPVSPNVLSTSLTPNSGFTGNIPANKISLPSLTGGATPNSPGIGATSSGTTTDGISTPTGGAGGIVPAGVSIRQAVGFGGTTALITDGSDSDSDDGLTDLDSRLIVQDGIVGILIKNTGSGYLRKPDGSLGGMNRTWATSNQTKVLKPDGTYLLPINPGAIVRLSVGDVVETPPNTKVITEPDDSGLGGGEEIIGGFSYTMKNNGIITAPAPNTQQIDGDLPMGANGTYPIITFLQGIFVENPGVNYQTGDEVVIIPDLGAKAEITVTPTGSIQSIRVTEQGEGFKEMPKAYIKSKTGRFSKLLPQLGVNRVPADLLREPGIADLVIQVTDVTGQVANQPIIQPTTVSTPAPVTSTPVPITSGVTSPVPNISRGY